VKGQRETTGAVVELTQRVGASCSFENTSGGHIAAVIGFNGQTRKVFLSSTTRDRNERHIALRYTRRALRDLGAAA
jgi:hypothetical protein